MRLGTRGVFLLPQMWAFAAASREVLPDYIVVGAGAAGCALAARLARAGFAVTLLEEGPDDSWTGRTLIDTPLDPYSLADVPYHVVTPQINRNYWTEPTFELPRKAERDEVALQGSSFYLLSQVGLLPDGHGVRSLESLAKIVGGCTMHNYAAYLRAGNESLRAFGPGWEPSVLLPKLAAMEAEDLKLIGPVRPELFTGPSKALLDAAVRLGYARTHRGRESPALPHAADGPVGYVGTLERTADAQGRRISAASAFLTDEVRNLPNFELRTNTLVRRVVFEGTRAVGVEFASASGAPVELRVRKAVILCSGTYNTPQLLMLSGVGPAAHLTEHGINVIADVPGVGRNLHNQLSVPFALRYTKASDATTNAAGPILGYFCSSQCAAGSGEADIHWLHNPLVRQPWLAPDEIWGIASHIGGTKPSGEIRLASIDMAEAPIVVANYFSTGTQAGRTDLAVTVEALEHLLALVNASDDLEATQPASGANLTQYALRYASTYNHPSGSCKMGFTSDADSVVDHALRVKGVTGLRVADASVMPRAPNANTAATSMLIGYHAADIVSVTEQPCPPCRPCGAASRALLFSSIPCGCPC